MCVCVCVCVCDEKDKWIGMKYSDISYIVLCIIEMKRAIYLVRILFK